jgi:membrane dipeptidase
VDGHVDLPYYMMNHARDACLSELVEGPFTLAKARQSRVRLFCSALYCEDRFNGAPSPKRVQEILRFTLARFDQVLLIREKTDLVSLRKDPDMLGTLLLLENADALVGNPSLLEELRAAGVRIVGLTHAGRNRIGDGNGVLTPGGLTREGIAVIEAIKDRALVIDIAHLHPVCFWRLLDLFDGPIISSHTGLREFCDIQRNIDMAQAKEIMTRDGLIGITFNPEMLSPAGRADLEDVFIHIDLLVQRFGPEGVGIGSDFCGFGPSTQGLEDTSRVPQLMNVMLEHGYGDEAVAGIMGLNWLRLYQGLY